MYDTKLKTINPYLDRDFVLQKLEQLYGGRWHKNYDPYNDYINYRWTKKFDNGITYGRNFRLNYTDMQNADSVYDLIRKQMDGYDRTVVVADENMPWTFYRRTREKETHEIFETLEYLYGEHSKKMLDDVLS